MSALVITGCSKPAPKPSEDAGAPAQEDPERPPTQQELPTTAGTLALDNLNGQIAGIEQAVVRNPRTVRWKLQLIELVSTRAKFVGTITDYERALTLAEECIAAEPKEAIPYLARASARAALHLFDAALVDLAEAERLGATPAQTRGVRASVMQGKGDLEGALAIRKAARAEHANISTLGVEAAVLAELGRFDEARPLFKQALEKLGDVSAVPVAWVLFQTGIMWERAGDRVRAKAFFAAARERFPAYAHAVSHEAVLETPARAIELLRPVVAASDDPEFEMILAQKLRQSGNTAEAEQRLAHVKTRYEELMSKHPEAFAEHAGWFWLDEGKDPAKALLFAKQNLALRKTEKAYELALLAATAAGAKSEACEIGTETLKRPRASEVVKAIAAKACPGR